MSTSPFTHTISAEAPDGGLGLLQYTCDPDKAEMRPRNYADGSSVALDWWKGKLQFLLYDAEDEPAVRFRMSRDGRVDEIIVRSDLMKHTHSEASDYAANSKWENSPSANVPTWNEDDWRQEVQEGNTRLGFEEWLEHKKEAGE